MQVGDVVHQRIGMDEELQVLILAHVVIAVLIHCFGIARRKVLYDQTQALLVLLHQLALVGVGDTADAWRQYVVDGLLATILFDADCAYRHRGAAGWSFASVKCLLIAAPITMYEVEGCQTHYNRLFKARQEHTHEANAGEVADVAHLRLITI